MFEETKWISILWGYTRYIYMDIFKMRYLQDIASPDQFFQDLNTIRFLEVQREWFFIPITRDEVVGKLRGRFEELRVLLLLVLCVQPSSIVPSVGLLDLDHFCTIFTSSIGKASIRSHSSSSNIFKNSSFGHTDPKSPGFWGESSK